MSRYIPSDRHILTKRYFRIFLASLFIFSAIHLLRLRISDTTLTSDSFPSSDSSPYTIDPNYPKSTGKPPEGQALPPLFEEWNQYERNLPQHDESLPPPEGKSARFLYIADHAHGAGWGNIIQEMFLNAHLAYATNRAFVFDNYTWDRHEDDYSEFNGKTVPSRTPVSTMLSGPIIGGPFSQPHPRAVHREYYRSLCPNPTVIHTSAISSKIGSNDALVVMNKWVQTVQELTRAMEAVYGEDSEEVRCIETGRFDGQLFHIGLFVAGGNVLSLWPTLRESPIIKQFAFSPLILSAYETNKRLFWPSSRQREWERLSLRRGEVEIPGDGRRDMKNEDLDTSNHPDSNPIIPIPIIDSPSIPGLLVIHLRRGDYEEHCRNLANWNEEYIAYNAADEFDEDDKMHLSQEGWEGEDEEKKRERKVEEYRKHCFPSMQEIVEKVERVRRDVQEKKGRSKTSAKWGGWWWKGQDQDQEEEGEYDLKRLYIMSNAPKDWLEELKDALRNVKSGGGDWEAIQTSRDLELSWEQKHVSQSLDMYVAMRSEAFIGNGFSSLTSAIVMMRMAKGVEPVYTRLW